MTFTRLPFWFCSALLAVLVHSVTGCGDGTIVFPGDDDDDDSQATVTVKGNLDDVFPVTTRDIVVFVYNIDDDSDRCPCPPDPSNSTKGKAVVIERGETEFTVSGIDSGSIGIVFLLDNAGNLADGEINDGDPIAVLDDVDCEIDDLDGNLTVTLEDIDIEFSTEDVDPDTCQDGDPPVAGRARADEIRQARTTAK